MAESDVQLLRGQFNQSADFSCRICLQILDNPLRLPCTHRFCGECLEPMLKKKSHSDCPICREPFNCAAVRKDETAKLQISSSMVQCRGCQKLVLASEMRSHEMQCNVKQVQRQFVPPANRVAPETSNRSTFTCPYCSEPNLTVDNLVEHCNQLHQRANRDAVCPVCAAMPWGDSQLKSANFIEHLNRRHKFEYHTYVDYGQSDEEMLQAALSASLQL